MRHLRKITAVVLLVAMTLAMAGCEFLKPTTATDHLEKLMEAYTSGDVETFKAGFEEDNKIHYMLDAVGDSDSTGMKGVFQKVYELTSKAEITVVGPNKEKDSMYEQYVTIQIKTVDFSEALDTAMLAAMEESGEAFADMPGWMMEALNTGGVPVEKEFEVLISSSGEVFPENNNKEFYDVLTGGFYDYILYTMTSCTSDEGNSYLLSENDEILVSYDEYSESVAGYGMTEADIEAYILAFESSYEGLEGLIAGGYYEGDVVTLYQVVSYTTASARTLQILGIVDSSDYDYISLDVTVDGYEEQGVTCETTDFGSGVLAKKNADAE